MCTKRKQWSGHPQKSKNFLLPEAGDRYRSIIFYRPHGTNGNFFASKKIDIEQNGITYVKNIFEETLPNGVNYTIYKDNGRKSYQNNFDHNDTPVYKVPKGHYFFMGDNRDNSIDSRFLKKIGYVSKNKILGKAKILFWTSDFSVLYFITKFRTNRAFKMIE